MFLRRIPFYYTDTISRRFIHMPSAGPSNKQFSKMALRSFGALIISGLALLGYFEYEKRQLHIKREASKNQSYGRPLIGGPWSLVNQDGLPVTHLDFAGKYMLIYFGYTFCPDVCPEELDKMAIIVDNLKKQAPNQQVVPIFISCDPKRDSVASIKEYVNEFHPDFIGLTGTYNQIKRIAKAYRLYFSAPPLSVDDDSTDYLVDHSIFFYLVDTNGKYISHYGRQETADEVTEKIINLIK